MSQLPIAKPYGSPSCWGQKYQDGDIECSQCRVNDSCKKEVLRGAIAIPINTVPFPQKPIQPVAAPQWPVQTPVQPPVVRTAPPPPIQQIPQQYQSSGTPVTPSYYQWQQPLQPWNVHPTLPSQIPDPLQPWARPGATAPPYYFNQYPGESHVQRFTKNILLRAIAAIAQELLGFFVHWTWPPSKDR